MSVPCVYILLYSLANSIIRYDVVWAEYRVKLKNTAALHTEIEIEISITGQRNVSLHLIYHFYYCTTLKRGKKAL